MPASFYSPGAPGRHPEAVPASQREQRFWMYLSSEEIPSRAGRQRGLLAVRPHYDESELSVWRVLSPDTVVIRLTGMYTRDYRFYLQGSADTLAGTTEYESHTGYRTYSHAQASRRMCPADSLSARDSLPELPGISSR